MTDEEIAKQVTDRINGVDEVFIDCYPITFFDHVDDKIESENYVGIIQGGYKDFMEDGLWDFAYHFVDSIEELKELKIGESLTDDDWGILQSISYDKAYTYKVTYKDKEIIHDCVI
jgi:hypothetical protein